MQNPLLAEKNPLALFYLKKKKNSEEINIVGTLRRFALGIAYFSMENFACAAIHSRTICAATVAVCPLSNGLTST
jgi:hypothetical protein